MALAPVSAHHNPASQVENRNDIHEASTQAVSVYWRGARGNMSIVIGWDIGGVHLKAARAESGRIVKAVQLAAPLRGGVECLAAAFTLAKAELGPAQHPLVTIPHYLALPI